MIHRKNGSMLERRKFHAQILLVGLLCGFIMGVSIMSLVLVGVR